MTIEFKVACTAQEIDHALWLRHQVYVVEEGLFGGNPLPDERVVDRFDVLPKVAHLIAYDDDEPIASVRLNCDTGLRLPPEQHFDFNAYRPLIEQDCAQRGETPVVASAGMLVIRKGWRRRRDVTREIYRVGIGVFHSWQVSHIILVVSADTALAYRRMGFTALSAPIWSHQIGNHIVPLMARAEDCYRWAFGESRIPTDTVWRERRKVHCNGCHGLTVAPRRSLQDRAGANHPDIRARSSA
jgi:predicted GNAT family N-acyltransferase